jgi:hypothetical protein
VRFSCRFMDCSWTSAVEGLLRTKAYSDALIVLDQRSRSQVLDARSCFRTSRLGCSGHAATTRAHAGAVVADTSSYIVKSCTHSKRLLALGERSLCATGLPVRHRRSWLLLEATPASWTSRSGVRTVDGDPDRRHCPWSAAAEQWGARHTSARRSYQRGGRGRWSSRCRS